MAATHVSTLQELMQRFWIQNNPMLLTLVLRECVAQTISRQGVRRMLHRFGIATVRKNPPETEKDTQTMVNAFMELSADVDDNDTTSAPILSSLTTIDNEDNDSDMDDAVDDDARAAAGSDVESTHEAVSTPAPSYQQRHQPIRAAAILAAATVAKTATDWSAATTMAAMSSRKRKPRPTTAHTYTQKEINCTDEDKEEEEEEEEGKEGEVEDLEEEESASKRIKSGASPPSLSHPPSSSTSSIFQQPVAEPIPMGAREQPRESLLGRPLVVVDDPSISSDVEMIDVTAAATAAAAPPAPSAVAPDLLVAELPGKAPLTTNEQKEIATAIAQSRADLTKRPLVAITPQQRKNYAAHVEQQLQAANCELRKVPGNGDCLFAVTILCCSAIGIDVAAELGLKSAHASHLRTFLADWIRKHKHHLFEFSGGDDSWRGEQKQPQRRTRKGGGSSSRFNSIDDRMTLDDCLDLLADTEERKWDIPWGSTEPGAAVTNLGDYIPQMIAIALKIRILQIKAEGPAQTVGERDPFGNLIVAQGREIIVVQSVRQDHWDAALPLSPLPAAEEMDDTAAPALDASAEDALAEGGEAGPAAAAAASRDATAVQAIGLSALSIIPPSSPVRRPVTHDPGTPSSAVSSEVASDPHNKNGARRRIFPDVPSLTESESQMQLQVQMLTHQLSEAQAMLKQSKDQHVMEIQQLAQAQAILQQNQEQHTMQMQQLKVQQAEVLTQQQDESDAASRKVAQTTRRIEELVHHLQQVHQNHQSHVQEPETADATHDVLQEICTLQSTLPSRDEAPFFHVPQQMVDQWTTEIEELETALAGPFHPTSPSLVDAVQAQLVCDRLTEMLNQLQSAELSFMQLLLLAKKLLCVDQLRPSEKNNPPYQTLELCALLLRLTVHDRLWSFSLRLPWSSFNSRRTKIIRTAANFYVNAAQAAAPDVMQQARLLVEQCKVLESGGAGMLPKAKKLNSITLKYPDQPFTVLQALHSRYPAAGPALDRAGMQQMDEEMKEWRSAMQKAQQHASSLEEAASSEGQVEAAQQARAIADDLSASPPRNFTQRMQRSCKFFHSDKRHGDDTSAAEQSDQFSQIKNAWDCLNGCRTHFQELRIFKAKIATIAS